MKHALLGCFLLHSFSEQIGKICENCSNIPHDALIIPVPFPEVHFVMLENRKKFKIVWHACSINCILWCWIFGLQFQVSHQFRRTFQKYDYRNWLPNYSNFCNTLSSLTLNFVVKGFKFPWVNSLSIIICIVFHP